MSSQQHESCPGEKYFDVKGDVDLEQSKSSESTDVPFSWRGDPLDTYSDCTINVVTNELETETYHVHKSIICFGTRNSKFFSKKFLNQTTKTHAKQPCAKVELDQRDAVNFPILLDFIYASCSHGSCATIETAASTLTSPSLWTALTDEENSNEFVQDLTSNNAVSLRFLAKKFEVDALIFAVNRFIQKDLGFQTGPTYLLQASEYKDERLFESARRLCAENFQQLDRKALTRLPLNLFRVLMKSLESFEEDNKDLSEFASEVVCRYLEKHPMVLTGELLLELTHPLLMPYIAPEAAIGFTALIKDLDGDDAQKNWRELVRFSRRCAKAVVQEYGWNDFFVNAAVDEYLGNTKSSQSSQEVSRLDSLLFATSFAAALEQAQDDYEELVVEQDRMERMVENLSRTVSLLEKVNEKKDEHLAKQQWAVDEAKKQIIYLKKELGGIKQHQQLKQLPSYDVLDHLSPLKDLISPSRVESEVHLNKSQRRKELKTKAEMRSCSLLR